MSNPIYSKQDYTQALMSLLPRGRAWAKETTSVMYTSLSFIGATYARLNIRSANLLVDAFPKTTVELLPEWESALGLPDPCLGPAPTLQERRGQVVARFANVGGQSVIYITQFAANLGYDISIKQFAPFRCGESRCGDQLGGEEWFFTWSIQSALNEIKYFRTGQSTAGEPLRKWSNEVLECEIINIAPAHTHVLFEYS